MVPERILQEGRITPHAVDIEEQIVGAMLLEKEAISKALAGFTKQLVSEELADRLRVPLRRAQVPQDHARPQQPHRW